MDGSNHPEDSRQSPKGNTDPTHTFQYEHTSYQSFQSPQTSTFDSKQGSQYTQSSQTHQKNSSTTSGFSQSSSGTTQSSATNSSSALGTSFKSSKRATFLSSDTGGASPHAGDPNSPSSPFDRSRTGTPFGRRTPAPPPDDVNQKIKPAQDDIGKLEQETKRYSNLALNAKASVKRRETSLREMLTKAQTDKIRVDKKLEALENEKYNLEIRLKTLTQSVSELTSQKKSLDISVQQKTVEVTQLRSNLKSKDAELEKKRDLERKVQQLTAEMENLKIQIQRLIEEKQQLVEEKQQLIEENRKMFDEIQSLHQQLKEKDDEIEQAESNYDKTIEAKDQDLLNQEIAHERNIKEMHEAMEVVKQESQTRYDTHIKEWTYRWETQSKTLQEWQRKYEAAIKEKKEGIEEWALKNQVLAEEYRKREQSLLDDYAALDEQYTNLCAKSAQTESEHVEIRRRQEELEERKAEFEEEVHEWKESFGRVERSVKHKEEELAAMSKKYTEASEAYRSVQKENTKLQSEMEKWQSEYKTLHDDFTEQREHWRTEHDNLRSDFSEKQKKWEAENQKLQTQLTQREEKWRSDYQKLQTQFSSQQTRLEDDYNLLFKQFKDKEDECQRLSKAHTDLDLEYQTFKTTTHEWRRNFEESRSKSVQEEIETRHRESTNAAEWAEDLAKLHLNEAGWEKLYRSLVAALQNPEKALAHLVVQLEANNQLLETIACSDEEDDWMNIVG
ncbi:hypothetical protein QBC38DRAFT_481915 [Podospora fimiseda]|uniref:Uncharacterized protein n=1 Tax=Podospora fimiseda TaxID=252190 RepID=A0AAN7BM51_9PEZI|nr:hypothetical protein QBC38DRAFT_481915 [Podospora fimiseda]